MSTTSIWVLDSDSESFVDRTFGTCCLSVFAPVTKRKLGLLIPFYPLFSIYVFDEWRRMSARGVYDEFKHADYAQYTHGYYLTRIEGIFR